MFIPHDTLPACSKIFIGKIEQNGVVKSYLPMDLCGWYNLVEACPSVLAKMSQLAMTPSK